MVELEHTSLRLSAHTRCLQSLLRRGRAHLPPSAHTLRRPALGHTRSVEHDAEAPSKASLLANRRQGNAAPRRSSALHNLRRETGHRGTLSFESRQSHRAWHRDKIRTHFVARQTRTPVSVISPRSLRVRFVAAAPEKRSGRVDRCVSRAGPGTEVCRVAIGHCGRGTY